jgi:uncharacterized SAM-binding protein YcdF (DUF218 family)
MKRILIILGCANDENGRLSETAIERLEEGIREYREHPGSAILPTGGFGAHFNTTDRPHAEYARDYLLERGIPEADILSPVITGNTVEDAVMSKTILDGEPGAAITIVTSDYHIERARFVFSRILAGRNISYRPARTDLPAERLEALRAHETRAVAEMARKGIRYGKERAKDR